jgi:DNA-directed RNA polymerase subunit RPC12/RpoP
MVAVRCQHCGFSYETDLPLRAVERIRRCSRCGHPSLVAVAAGEDEPAPAGSEAPSEERREA